jgi:hypothetical protein
LTRLQKMGYLYLVLTEDKVPGDCGSRQPTPKRRSIKD